MIISIGSFKRNETLNAYLYAQELQRVYKVMVENVLRLSIRNTLFTSMTTQDPYASRITQKHISKLSLSVLPHTPYSPYFISTSYCHCQSLQNALMDKTVPNEDQIQDFIETISRQTCRISLKRYRRVATIHCK